MDPQLDVLNRIADSLKTHPWPTSFSDFAQIALAVLTVVTIYYLRKYTKETVELRKATRDQVEVNSQVLRETVELRKATQEQVEVNTNMLTETGKLRNATQEQVIASNALLRESQQQTEHALMPMVMLIKTPRKAMAAGFSVKNAGNGPALNVSAIVLENPALPPMEFEYNGALAVGQEDSIRLIVNREHTLIHTRDDIASILRQGDAKVIRIRLVYKSVMGKEYETIYSLTLHEEEEGLIRVDAVIFQFDSFGPLEFIAA
ncbi:MAG TPA: hypothetical protein VN736_01080 [Candidatus Limnocylindrales bacterium]|nr:hypothetical protein [Candidatus Limnocylindrales bacterium]